MANAVYQEYKQNLLAGTSSYDLDVDDATNGPFCALIDTGTYTFSQTHEFFSSLSGIVGTDQRITAPTVANGTFDGGDLTYTAVSGASVEGFVIYRHNAGANTTWPLVLYYDASGGGLPVTPNGGNITVTWNGSGIFTISDRRMKENVRQIGHAKNVLPIYEYSYLGEERSRVGLMAQDVEKIAPAAVIDLGKYKAVNYELAIEAVYAEAA